jgi:hypothetical protein
MDGLSGFFDVVISGLQFLFLHADRFTRFQAFFFLCLSTD